MPKEGITLQAIFVRASTLVDGSWRLSFDVSAHEAQAIIELAQHRDRNLLQLAIIPIPSQTQGSKHRPGISE